MSALLVAVQETREQRDEGERAFREALSAAWPTHSWAQVADAAGLSIAGTRYLVLAFREENGE